LPSELGQGAHRADDLGDLTGAAVVGPVDQRDPAIGGDPEAGLDLLEVRAAVLGMAVPGAA
jgi:hypothetical protein